MTITVDQSHSPYIGADYPGDSPRLDADHPLAQRLRDAGQGAVNQLLNAVREGDGLHMLGKDRVILIGGKYAWVAQIDRRGNCVRVGRNYCGPQWSERAVRAVAKRRTIAQQVAEERSSAEAAEWRAAIAETY